MSKARAPFTSIRVLPSGRFRARYRPRHAEHHAKTFDTREEAHGWLTILKEKFESEGDVSRITARREYQTGGAR